jgi:hypothetical protein
MNVDMKLDELENRLIDLEIEHFRKNGLAADVAALVVEKLRRKIAERCKDLNKIR